ncbi:MAG: Fic family protein [Eggerthellaceae bacterium]|nr:Fic family protein [Eggerthellaceae bacterium]
MRTFDYGHLPKGLFGGAVGDANMKVFEDKGKLDVYEQMHPELLESFRASARTDSADASARIEGLYIDKARVADLMAGGEALGETEEQIAGYARALDLIDGEIADIDLSTATILKLYETMYGYRDLGRKSRYRKKDYIYVQVDGHMQAMPVSPITAFETPLVLGGACDSLAEAFTASHASPLVLASVFTVDFLCIRPFDEGNGRIARLFADLMLKKAGFGVSRYMSLDRIIEGDAMDYYNALNACVEGWDRGRNDYKPYALYWLEHIHSTYQRLFETIEAALREPGGKSERVRAYILNSQTPVTKRQILDAFPEISEATVENALGKMVKAGEARKVGAGRSTAYVH